MIRWRYSHRDANHKPIVDGLRDAGRQVVELHAVGGGVPDILVLWPGGFRLMEIKNPARRKKGDRSLKGQAAFREAYRGPPGTICVVETLGEALAATGIRAGIP